MPHGNGPESIDSSFVARVRSSVHAESVGAETVLVDSESGQVHILNPVAALVWQCFDGEASLEDLVVDLAEGFGAPVDVVRQDVVAMTRSAGMLGLLDGVEPSRIETSSAISGLAEGESVVIPRDSDAVPGRRTLLVNWSATCGFCVGMLLELATLQPALDSAATDIVLVDEHDQEATTRLLDKHGLIAGIVSGATQGTSSVAAFTGMGTPVAYLLDSDDRVASPLAYGAGNVLELARCSSDVATVTVGDDEPTAEPPRFLPVAGGVCAPAVSKSSPAREWERAAAYKIGSYRVGIRASSPSVAEAIAQVFVEQHLDDDVLAPDNYSVILSEGSSPGRRDLSLLLAGSVTLARTRSPRRLIRALAGHLSCLLEPESGLRRLDAIGALIDGEAVLLPKAITLWPERLQAPLARLGFSVVDEPFAHLDPATGELVVSASRIPINEVALAHLEDPEPGNSEPAVVPPGRYPVAAWLLPASPTGGEGSLSPAGAVAGALGTLVGSPKEVAAAIGTFVSILEGVETVSVPCDRPEDLVGGLRNWCSAAESRK